MNFVLSLMISSMARNENNVWKMSVGKELCLRNGAQMKKKQIEEKKMQGSFKHSNSNHWFPSFLIHVSFSFPTFPHFLIFQTSFSPPSSHLTIFSQKICIILARDSMQSYSRNFKCSLQKVKRKMMQRFLFFFTSNKAIA